MLQCLAQTSTFTLDIDANVKSLGAIGQALQKVMKDLRSETWQHPIQRRKKGSLPDGEFIFRAGGGGGIEEDEQWHPSHPPKKLMVVVKEVSSNVSLQSCVFFPGTP